PRPPQSSHPFPYTTLFRSRDGLRRARHIRHGQPEFHGRHIELEAGGGEREHHVAWWGGRVPGHRRELAARGAQHPAGREQREREDRKSTRLNSSHLGISYA